jgi:hypothetical protein
MRFLPRLKESISDLVNRSESNEVVCFICVEGLGPDPKELSDFLF